MRRERVGTPGSGLGAGRSQPHAASPSAATARADTALKARRSIVPGRAKTTGSAVVATGSARVTRLYVKLSSASAAANSAALSKRSAGSFSSARANALSTWGGTVLRTVATGCGSVVRIWTSTA